MDDIKRGKLIKIAVRIIHEDVPTMTIYNYVAVYGMKKNIDYKPTQRDSMSRVLVRYITVR